MTVQGDYEQLDTGRLILDIGADGFDTFRVNGAAVLDGIVEIRLVGGYVPKPNESFTIFSAQSYTGGFANLMDRVGVRGGTFEVSSPVGELTLFNFDVPEPSMAIVALLAAAAVAQRRRRSFTVRDADTPDRRASEGSATSLACASGWCGGNVA